MNNEPIKSFPEWAFSTVEKHRKLAGIGTIFAASISIGFLNPTAWIFKESGQAKMALEALSPQLASLFLVQMVACIILAVSTPRAKVPDSVDFIKLTESQKLLAKTACLRIQMNLIGIFILWAVYYMTAAMSKMLLNEPTHTFSIADLSVRTMAGFFIGLESPYDSPKVQVDQLFLLTLSAVNSLFIFWLYLEMSELTVSALGSPVALFDQDAAKVATAKDDVVRHRLIAAGILLITLICVWFAYAAQTRHGDKLLKLMDIAISCLGGVSMCLVVGRLGYEKLNPGQITLALLYFYAVIQPAASLFSENPVVFLICTSLALPLKVLLWLVCVWAFTTGVLGEYVYDVRKFLEGEAKGKAEEAKGKDDEPKGNAARVPNPMYQ